MIIQNKYRTFEYTKMETMCNFKLKEALKRKNEETGEFMSQLEFSKLLFADHNPKTALYHTSMACNGHAFGRFTPEVILKVCEILECDPNFLFNYKPIKNKINGTITEK